MRFRITNKEYCLIAINCEYWFSFLQIIEDKVAYFLRYGVHVGKGQDPITPQFLVAFWYPHGLSTWAGFQQSVVDESLISGERDSMPVFVHKEIIINCTVALT